MLCGHFCDGSGCCTRLRAGLGALAFGDGRGHGLLPSESCPGCLSIEYMTIFFGMQGLRIKLQRLQRENKDNRI